MPSIKSIFTEDITKRLYFYSLLFFALLLPFQFRSIPITLGLMFYSLIWLLSLQFGHKLRLLTKNRMVALLLLYAVLIAIGAVYSTNPGEAEKDMLLKVPFAAWPILLGSVGLFLFKQKQKLVDAFIYAMVAAIVVAFAQSWYQYFTTGDDSYLYFSKLMHFDLIPPHYFGMYVNFAYGVVFYRLLHDKVIGGKMWLSLIILLVLFITLIFLSVRMQYLVFILVNVGILFLFKNPVKLKTKVAWSLGALIGLFLLAYALPGSRARLHDTVNEALSFERVVNQKQTNHRKFIWKDSWTVIQNNFWIGTGTGAGNQALNEELQDEEAAFWDGQSVYYLRDKDYNYHNSYLQHWATHGIIGLAIFLAILLVPLFRKDVPVEGKIFLVVCMFSFITESMLERQAGVLFFTFFYSVFFVMKPLKKDEPEIEAIV